MKKLTDDVRRFIVHCLAAFDTPTKVAESVKSEFGLDVTRQAVASHDPTKKTGQQLAQRWKDEFHEARRKFLEELDEIPIANKAYRLRQLGDLYGNAGKNAVLKMQLLKQAAEEVGGVYTNKVKNEHTGKDGTPLPAGSTNVTVAVTPEAVKAAMKELENEY